MRFLAAVLALTACGSVKDEDKPDAPKAADAAVDGSGGNIDAPMVDAPMLEVPANPKLWLKFDDAPTDGVLDSANPAHTAACATSSTCPTLVAGKKGSAYQFSADRIDVLNSDLNAGTGFTIAAWIRLDTSTTENSIGVCEANTGAGDCIYGLFAAVGNHPAWYGGSAAQTTGSATLAVGTWYHTMIIYDGSNRKTYLNGTLVDSLQATMGGTISKMTIGSRDFPAGSALNFPGSIDEVLFYDRVLTAAEITLISTP